MFVHVNDLQICKAQGPHQREFIFPTGNTCLKWLVCSHGIISLATSPYYTFAQSLRNDFLLLNNHFLQSVKLYFMFIGSVSWTANQSDFSQRLDNTDSTCSISLVIFKIQFIETFKKDCEPTFRVCLDNLSFSMLKLTLIRVMICTFFWWSL